MMASMRTAGLCLALCLAAASAAEAQIRGRDYEVEIAPDQLTIREPDAPARHRRGRRLVAGDMTLAQPIVDSGRVISRVAVMQEWDCAAGRYRTVRRIFRDDNGLFVHSEPRDDPWTTVARDGAGWATMQRVCPAQAEDAPAAATPARSGPQVVTMPRG